MIEVRQMSLFVGLPRVCGQRLHENLPYVHPCRSISACAEQPYSP